MSLEDESVTKKVEKKKESPKGYVLLMQEPEVKTRPIQRKMGRILSSKKERSTEQKWDSGSPEESDDVLPRGIPPFCVTFKLFKSPPRGKNKKKRHKRTDARGGVRQI